MNSHDILATSGIRLYHLDAWHTKVTGERFSDLGESHLYYFHVQQLVRYYVINVNVFSAIIVER